MAKGKHLARIDRESLLITFEMCRAVALVGTANVLKNAKRCSGREGTGGGGSSEPGGAGRRMSEVMKCSFKAKQSYLKKEKEITNVITPSKGEMSRSKDTQGQFPVSR